MPEIIQHVQQKCTKHHWRFIGYYSQTPAIIEERCERCGEERKRSIDAG
jgi:hypothetical protein